MCFFTNMYSRRFIYDVTDHVWCELWMPEMDRWVHCDPCENSIDAPLLYEKVQLDIVLTCVTITLY